MEGFQSYMDTSGMEGKSTLCLVGVVIVVVGAKEGESNSHMISLLVTRMWGVRTSPGRRAEATLSCVQLSRGYRMHTRACRLSPAIYLLLFVNVCRLDISSTPLILPAYISQPYVNGLAYVAFAPAVA